MDESRKLQLKSRLKDRHDEATKNERRNAAWKLEKQIAETLRDMNRDLLILMKTNHYLRAIDIRLGNPTNTFTQVNEVTWKVYKNEVGKNHTLWQYCRQAYRFYYLKFGLFLYYVSVQCRRMLGLSVSQEELEDMEMDFIEHKEDASLA